MNILFIELHNNNPFSVTCGSIQRSNLLIQACAQIAHVDVVVFNNDDVNLNIKNCDVIYCNDCNKDRRSKLLEFWRKIYCLFGSGELYFEMKNKEIEQALDNIILNIYLKILYYIFQFLMKVYFDLKYQIFRY